MGMKMQDSTTLNQATWNANTTAGAAGTGATVNFYAWGYQSALITYQNSGTVSAGTVTWEGFDGFNWYVIPASLIVASPTPALTYTLTTGSGAFYANINGFSQFRTRLSVAITGTTPSVLVTINGSAASNIVA